MNQKSRQETNTSCGVTVPRLFADLGAERVKEKNDLSSLKAWVDPFAQNISAPQDVCEAGGRSPRRIVSGWPVPGRRMARFRRGFLSPSSSRGLDKKRSHFPLKINKTGGKSEHAPGLLSFCAWNTSPCKHRVYLRQTQLRQAALSYTCFSVIVQKLRHIPLSMHTNKQHSITDE